MRLDARGNPDLQHYVLYDRGTGKRIPLAFWCDLDTGAWKAWKQAPNGIDILLDDDDKPIIIEGRAKGQLELVEIGRAHDLMKDAPKPVKSIIRPMSPDEKVNGLDMYKRVFTEVWRWRGESGRCVLDRWDEFLSTNEFLDAFVLRRRTVAVEGPK